MHDAFDSLILIYLYYGYIHLSQNNTLYSFFIPKNNSDHNAGEVSSQVSRSNSLFFIFKWHNSKVYTTISSHTAQLEECPQPASEVNTAQLKAVSAVSQLTVASSPVRSAPAQSSYALERRPKHDHHHRPVDPTVQVYLSCTSCQSRPGFP